MSSSNASLKDHYFYCDGVDVIEISCEEYHSYKSKCEVDEDKSTINSNEKTNESNVNISPKREEKVNELRKGQITGDILKERYDTNEYTLIYCREDGFPHGGYGWNWYYVRDDGSSEQICHGSGSVYGGSGATNVKFDEKNEIITYLLDDTEYSFDLKMGAYVEE